MALPDRIIGRPPYVKEGGAQQLVVDIRRGLPGLSASAAIENLLTFGGRMPLDHARVSMTPFEQRVLRIATEQPDLRLGEFDPTGVDNTCVIIQERRIGHVSIVPFDELSSYPRAPDAFIAGTVQLQPDDYQDLIDYKTRAEQQFADHVAREVTPALAAMEQSGELPSVVSNIRENLLRVGPVFVHVGDSMYSTSDLAEKNLIDRGEGGNRLLSTIAQQPLDTWSLDDQVFIYGSHLLLQSGGASRFEEFNAGQLSPEILHQFFDGKLALYGRHLQEFSQSAHTLQEKASLVGQQFQKINTDFQRYRNINGLTIRQEEAILGPKTQEMNLDVIPELQGQVEKLFGLQQQDDESAVDYWKRVGRYVVSLDAAGGEHGEIKPLALLLWTIIQAGVTATNSDIGMSSSFRDVKQLVENGPLDLKKLDFYCCVVPSQKFVETRPQDEVTKTLELIAKRMEYNRWHFIPGNMEREQIPPTREWFYPPAIPDIATETDFHHGGHVAAGVHNSLRYPSSLTIDGVEHKGAFDIRFMRQEGNLYSPDDIHVASNYLNVLGLVMNTIVESIQTEPVRITDFTGSWYRNQVWKQYMDITR